MKKLTWWLRIVGVVYVLLGVSNVIYEIIDPQFVAQGMVPVSYSPDAVTVTALVHTFLPSSLTFLVLGVLMLVYANRGAQARALVLVVALLELLAWVPYDLVWFAVDLPIAPAIPFLIGHFVIGITGVLFLRSEAKQTSLAAFPSVH